MQIYYVDSAATGAADGTTKTDAWTSINSVPTLNPGDQVFFSHTHSESASTSNMPGDGGARAVSLPELYSVDFTGSTPPVEADITKGATIGNTSGNLVFANSGIWQGFIFNAVIDIQFSLADEHLELYDCTLAVGLDDDWNMILSGNAHVILVNTVFAGTNNTSADNLGGLMIDSGESGHLLCIGCSADTSLQWKDELIKTTTRPGKWTFIGCDFSNWGSNSGTHTIIGGTMEADVHFIGCDFQSGASMLLGAGSMFQQGSVRFTGCGDNNNIDQEQTGYVDLWHVLESYGGGQSGKAGYRTSGFTPPHQTNPICIRVSENSTNASPTHPTRIPLSIYNTATAATKTLTVEFIAADGSAVDPLDYTEVWLEVLYYDDAGTLLTYESNRETLIKSTPTAHAAGVGTGSWTLTNAETNRTSYKLALTTAGTIAQEGIIHVNVVVGDIGGNDALYIDPMVTIT